jgi:hypothetical protein
MEDLNFKKEFIEKLNNLTKFNKINWEFDKKTEEYFFIDEELNLIIRFQTQIDFKLIILDEEEKEIFRIFEKIKRYETSPYESQIFTLKDLFQKLQKTIEGKIKIKMDIKLEKFFKKINKMGENHE